MFRTPVIAALALLAAAPSLPRTAELAAPAAHRYDPASEGVGWSYGAENVHDDVGNRLRFFRRDRFDSSMGSDDGADVQAIAASIERAHPGDEIAFSLAREAGALACTGRAEKSGRASGTCRFDPSEGFAAAMAQRGIAPKDGDEMLGLTLVDAHLATVDGLKAQGFRFNDAGELIAVSALHVTPGYADELRGAGLRIDALGDLIAARALKIDGQWLGEMARAGYPDLAVGKAIQMRALGITPDYAMKMARVLHAAHEIE